MSLHDNNSTGFRYLWVVRCSGSRINSNLEYKIIPEAPGRNITPLIEVIDEEISTPFRIALRRKYHRVFIEFPAYLNEQGNKFRAKPDTTLRDYTNCIDFFNAISLGPDIPVVSAFHDPRDIAIDYSLESMLVDGMPNGSGEVAVRIRVPTVNLSSSTNSLNSYNYLLEILRGRGSLFLDIFNMSRGFVQTTSNLRLMCTLARALNIPVFVLNAFEPRDMAHNYGPFFSKHLDLEGFGDFATEFRFPQNVRINRPYSDIRKTIRLYDWNRFVLRDFSQYTYAAAVSQLTTSRLWINNGAHISSCPACRNVSLGVFNESRSYWKSFRIQHYLHCMANETCANYLASSNAEDMDPDGYDTFFSSGGTG